MQWIAPEINSTKATTVALVGRDPGGQEAWAGKAFVGPAGKVLWDAASEAGLRRQDCNVMNVVGVRPPGDNFHAHRRDDVERGVAELQAMISRLQPNVVVALGNEAAHALIPDWPSKNASGIFGATDIQNRRGYVFEGFHGGKVIPTIHPAAVARDWVPWRMLLSYDLQRAKEEASSAGLERPVRNVEVVTSEADAERWVERLGRARFLACDIENYDATELACVGFAASSREAVVFPGGYLDYAARLLGTEIPKVFHNGQYDLYFLLTRCGIKVEGDIHDTIIAFHACYPELAGKSETGKRRTTRKSLKFLASLLPHRDEWWKDYDFTSDMERFILNGKDCCVTFDAHTWLQSEIARLGVHSVYDHERSLIWPCVVMQQRGLHVNVDLRRDRLERIQSHQLELQERLTTLAIPLLEERWEKVPAEKRRLFQQKNVCSCCRGGKAKSQACWSCAGFSSKPGKKALSASGSTLTPCQRCGGLGKWDTLSFNPASDQQVQVLLYDLLKLPKRTKRNPQGKTILTVDEDALKGILGTLPAPEVVAA